MGNCQASDAAVIVIQHPDGKSERLYWPTTADVVMRHHPDRYIVHVTFSGDRRRHSESAAGSSVRFNNIRLLKHKEILLIGEVYRIMTSQEMMKEMRSRKQERLRKAQNVEVKNLQNEIQKNFFQLLELQNQRVEEIRSYEDSMDSGSAGVQVIDQTGKHEREKQRSLRTWRPSLDSISEIGI